MNEKSGLQGEWQQLTRNLRRVQSQKASRLDESPRVVKKKSSANRRDKNTGPLLYSRSLSRSDDMREEPISIRFGSGSPGRSSGREDALRQTSPYLDPYRDSVRRKSSYARHLRPRAPFEVFSDDDEGDYYDDVYGGVPGAFSSKNYPVNARRSSSRASPSGFNTSRELKVRSSSGNNGKSTKTSSPSSSWPFWFFGDRNEGSSRERERESASRSRRAIIPARTSRGDNHRSRSHRSRQYNGQHLVPAAILMVIEYGSWAAGHIARGLSALFDMYEQHGAGRDITTDEVAAFFESLLQRLPPKPTNQEELFQVISAYAQFTIYFAAFGFAMMFLGHTAAFVAKVGSWVAWFLYPFVLMFGSLGRIIVTG